MNWVLIKGALLCAPVVALLLEFLLYWRLAHPSRRQRTAVLLIGLAAASKFFFFKLLGGDAFNPELPRWLIIAWGYLESVVWVALPVSFIAALVAWSVRPFRRFAFVTVLAVSVPLAAYGMWEGFRVPPVVEREIEVEDLPTEFAGYVIAHLSDLHCSSATLRDKLEAIVERTNRAEPDMVAITGDLVDGFPETRERDLEPLKGLRTKDGVFICAGNHERYFRISRWEPLYRQWGLRPLRNEWVSIRRGQAELTIGGLDDEGIGERTDLVFRGAPSGGCRVLLQHRPIGTVRNERLLDVRLQLSGHTHGEAVPLLSVFVAMENEGHLRGVYREGKLLLHVSPGSGQWAGFPLRFFNPPEITVLKLKPKL